MEKTMENIVKLNLDITKKDKHKDLPKYSKGEELINAISHIVGASLFIAGLVLCLVFANDSITVWGRVALIVYCVSIILMFTTSCIYHFLGRNSGKKVFRIFDHCAIFLAIAGTYTPFCFITLADTLWGTLIGIFVWLLAILGIVLNAVGLNKKSIKVFSIIAYLAMGWCIVVALIPLLEVLDFNGFLWLLAGGLAYSLGAIFYGVGKKKKYMHCLWHFFVLIGAILQFIAVFFYVVL
ncbi:MAG: hemolysin III family protein [Clostridia bacterium]|nr:hemolysin III family protein [Clostridia bacterium]